MKRPSEFANVNEILTYFSVSIDEIEASIINPALVKREGDNIVFASDRKVIGHYNPEDPDGGRMIYNAAVVKRGTTDIRFEYREKWYTGLQLSLTIDGVYSDFTYREDTWPSWIKQEEE